MFFQRCGCDVFVFIKKIFSFALAKPNFSLATFSSMAEEFLKAVFSFSNRSFFS